MQSFIKNENINCNLISNYKWNTDQTIHNSFIIRTRLFFSSCYSDFDLKKNISNDELNPVLKNITGWYTRVNNKIKINVAVLHIFFIKVTYVELIYARTVFVLKYEVPFHLMKRWYYYTILKTLYVFIYVKLKVIWRYSLCFSTTSKCCTGYILVGNMCVGE